MRDRAGKGIQDDSSPDALLATVFSAPKRALADAARLLAGRPEPAVASIAHQVIGIVQRDFGDVAGAVDHLRRAMRLARRSNSPEREGDVCATLGVALIQSGHSRSGLAMLDRAVALSRGAGRARARFRRAGALRILGRNDEAMAEVGRAIPPLRRAGDTLWAARALTLRAGLHLRAGAVSRAHADYLAAERMFDTIDQEHDSALASQNLGCVALARGDLPAALRLLAEADNRFKALGTPMYSLVVDRCDTLLAAGLAADALAEADRAIEALHRQRGQATRRAELTLLAARAALAAVEVPRAIVNAQAAQRMFARQRRPWWSLHARLLEVQARVALGDITPGLAAAAARLARELAGVRSGQAAQAHLAAGQCCLALSGLVSERRGWGREALGHLEEAARHRRAWGPKALGHLEEAAWHRHRGGPQARISAWLALALRAEACGDGAGLRSACSRGLALLDGYRLMLGAAELRALITGHGTELIRLALRNCAEAGDARALLAWTERWRSVSLDARDEPAGDPVLTEMLAGYRAVAKALENSGPATDLLRHKHSLELRIRERVRQRAGVVGTPKAKWNARRLLDALAGGHLLEIVEVDGAVHRILCGPDGIRRFEPVAGVGVGEEVAFARSALRRLAFGRDADLSTVEESARRLEAILIGPSLDSVNCGEDGLVIVPPAWLHGVPWGLLPGLRGRAVSVAPSASAWLRARETARPEGDGRVVLVRGPGLAGTELDWLAGVYPHATLLDAGGATVSAVLAAIEGGALAHIAAHGAVRADNPLFSNMMLADGPLTIHDVAELRRAPYRLILPSCESAGLTPVGADELLGLAAALLPRGTAGIVATADPVNDEAAAELMTRLHTALLAGAPTLAHALRDARMATSSDAVRVATAASFIAIGAA